MRQIRLSRLTTLGLASVVSLTFLAGCSGAPAVEPSSQAANLDDWGDNMQGCLEEAGWEVEITPDGGIRNNVPEGQESTYDADYSACEASFGYDVPPTYTDEEVRAIYEEVVATATCLEEHGHSPGTPPTEQTFVEQVQSGPGGWDPYSDLYPEAMSDERYYAALEECPRTWH